MKNKSAAKIKIAGFDDLFGIKEESEDRIIEVPISILHTFKNHPFHVLENSQMEEMIESIKEYGVLVPGLVRLRADGEYELIAGHRRKHACLLAGKKSMPVIIKTMTDDEAIIAMVDSNIQRDNLLYSEKAYALRLKYEAMKHQGSKGTMTTTALIGESIGESGKQVQRYIRLTYLHPEIMVMVDNKQISFIPSVDISFLGFSEQECLLSIIKRKNIFPTGVQALKLKELSLKGQLTEETIDTVMVKKQSESIKVSISAEKVCKYFPKDYTKQDIINAIVNLIEENWKRGGII